MIRGFYTAGTGLRAQQTNMDTIANNMANVNTVGYKSTRVSFTDLMYQNLNSTNAESTAIVGHGVKVNKTDLNMNAGALQSTQLALDFALDADNAFFALEDANGNISYTRAGNFILSDDDGTFFLAAANGDRVLDEDGEEIEIEFDDDGEIILDVSQIGVYRFSNPYGLALLGDNRFGETDLSGEGEAIEEPRILQGFLEGSSVEVSNEMTRVIEASKAFSFNSRMIQVADEVEQTINQLR